MNQRRVPVDTTLYRGPQTQVRARPVNTYSGHQVAPTNTPAMQLAAALSNIRPQLNGYLQTKQAEYELEQEERAYDALQGMTFEDAKGLVDSGQLEQIENPWYQAAFKKQFGLAYASRRRRQVVDEYNNSFDKHGGDLDEFLAGFVQADAEKYGADRHIYAGIREGMAGLFDQVRDGHREWQSQTVRDTSLDQFFDVGRLQVDRALSAGEDPSAALRSIYGPHREMLGLTYAEMDDLALSLAESYASEGNVAAVEALLTTDIVGEDGQKVGSFVNRPKYANKARSILDTARANQGAALRQENTEHFVDLRTRAEAGALDSRDIAHLDTLKETGQLTQAQHEAILYANQQGLLRRETEAYVANVTSAHAQQVNTALLEGVGNSIRDFTFTDPSGREHTIRAEDAITAAVTEQLDTMAAGGSTTTEMAAHLSRMGVDVRYEPWVKYLTNGHVAAHQALDRSGGEGNFELPPAAQAGFTLWTELATFPRLRARLVGDSDARNTYEWAEALTHVGYSPDEALILAAQTERQGGGVGLTSQRVRDQLDRAVRSAARSGWFRTDAGNRGYVEDTIRATAEVLIATARVGPEDAVKEAARLYDESHTTINGISVNTRNQFIPPNFEEAAAHAISAYAANNGADARDLTLRPADDTGMFWQVVYKGIPMPHENWIDGGGRLHINQIMGDFDASVLGRVNEEIGSNATSRAPQTPSELRDRINPLGATR